MKFPNGDIYEGEWEHQLMHGEGQLYDRLGNLTSGIWVSGCFNSIDQPRLQKEREVMKRKDQVAKRALLFFEQFQAAFAKSDKKTMKENLLPFFASE